jgi:DNA invertase Pin-like site-specific DNA recombinase
MKTVRKISVGAKAPPKRKRVEAYARGSMESDRLVLSLSAQISYYSGLIQKNPEWEFAGVYADGFVSGTSAERRAEFQRMLADCEAGRIDLIVTKSVSRFARNTVYSLTTIRQLKENGTEVYFEKEALYPSLSKKVWLLITYIKVIERIK